MSEFPYTIKFGNGPDGLFCIDLDGTRHLWRESKCKLKLNKNQYGLKLHPIEEGTVGKLITYRNSRTGKTTWQMEFGDYRFDINDSEVFERVIEPLKK